MCADIGWVRLIRNFLSVWAVHLAEVNVTRMYLLLSLAIGCDRVATGTVVSVDIDNGTCNKSQDCTTFTSRIQYVVDGNTYTAVDRSWKLGHDRLAADAPYRPGDKARVGYTIQTPEMGMVLSTNRLGSIAFVGVMVLLAAAGNTYRRTQR